jgi:hypothetical protein
VYLFLHCTGLISSEETAVGFVLSELILNLNRVEEGAREKKKEKKRRRGKKGD